MNIHSLPVVTTSGGSTNFTGSSVAVDSALTVNSTTTTLASATVAITGNFNSGEDVLSFNNTSAGTFGNITSSYNSITGILTFTSSGATATLAQWQAALRAVTYSNSSSSPNTSPRALSFTINDGVTSSTAANRMLNVQLPVVTTSTGLTNFTGSSVAVDSALTVSDATTATLASATVAITGNFHAGEDVLAFTNTSTGTFGNILASYNSFTGVLTLISSGATATLAQWQEALRAVTYSNSSSSPNMPTRTLSFIISDVDTSSPVANKTLNVKLLPVVTTSSGSASFMEAAAGPSTPVAVDSGLTVTSASTTTLASAAVAITGNFHSNEDALVFDNTDQGTFGNINASYNLGTGILTLTSSGATATLAQWQAALREVTYTNTSIDPNIAIRTITFTVSDGIYSSDNATRTITVTSANNAPNLTAIALNPNYNAGGSAVALFRNANVSAIEANQNINQLIINVAGIADGQSEVLDVDGSNVPLTNGNSVSTTNGYTVGVSVVSNIATVTISGNKSVTEEAALINGLTYKNSSPTPSGTSRTFTLSSIKDNGGTSNGGIDTRTLSYASTVSVIQQYTVTYNANGGTGNVPAR